MLTWLYILTLLTLPAAPHQLVHLDDPDPKVREAASQALISHNIDSILFTIQLSTYGTDGASPEMTNRIVDILHERVLQHFGYCTNRQYYANLLAAKKFDIEVEAKLIEQEEADERAGEMEDAMQIKLKMMGLGLGGESR